MTDAFVDKLLERVGRQNPTPQSKFAKDCELNKTGRFVL
jgi:hypothetical protein